MWFLIRKRLKENVENQDYLTKQIITYIGNKRLLLPQIKQGVEIVLSELNQDKLSCLDLFAGSGIVSRFLKKYADQIIANDLEYYSYVINDCYLSNKTDVDQALLHYFIVLKSHEHENNVGFVTQLYAPNNDNNIQKGERVFYTKANAMYIDNMSFNIFDKVPDQLRKYFIAPLLSEASIHVNTAGIFKAFYKDGNGIGSFGARGKNALSRIKGKICLEFPIFSNYKTSNTIFQEDANLLVDKLPMVDLCYLDPPYNQHPYGSNYFMLNCIAKNEKPLNISTVSGIPNDWQRSDYNSTKKNKAALIDLIGRIKAKYILLSFNNEGFIDYEELVQILNNYGFIRIIKTKYNAYRGSRNLKNRETHVSEYLFLLKKEEYNK